MSKETASCSIPTVFMAKNIQIRHSGKKSELHGSSVTFSSQKTQGTQSTAADWGATAGGRAALGVLGDDPKTHQFGNQSIHHSASR